MQRWVGLGVISDNLLNIGRVMSARAARKPRLHYCSLQTPAPHPGGVFFAERC